MSFELNCIFTLTVIRNLSRYDYLKIFQKIVLNFLPFYTNLKKLTAFKIFDKFRIRAQGDSFNRFLSSSTCFNKLLMFLSNVLTRIL